MINYRLLLTVLYVILVAFKGFTQTESPYHTSFKVDGSIIAGGVGLSALGLSLIKSKDELTVDEVNALNKDDVFFLDRFVAGNYSDRADKVSYYPFFASFAVAPIMVLADKSQRSDFGQIMVLFVETMGITGAGFTLSAGLVERSRPLVYNTSIPMEERTDKDAQRSFYAGHTAATAAATFFAAKVFHDFHPGSKAAPYVWAAAAIIPASVGYLRLKGGKHFLTDNLLGYAIGAGTGILVPQLHKKSNKIALSVSPAYGYHYKGLQISYTFRN